YAHQQPYGFVPEPQAKSFYGTLPVNFARNFFTAKVIAPLVGQSLRVATELVFIGGRIDRNGQAIPDSLSWNAVISGSQPEWHLDYYAGLYNVLDDRNGPAVGWNYLGPTVPQVGRTFRLGLTLHFF